MVATRKAPTSDLAIGKLPPVDAEVLMPFGGSLYLKRRPNGRQSWVLRTRIGGKWRVTLLGDWPTVGLHLARQRAEAGRVELAPATADSTLKAALDSFKRQYLAQYRTASARHESGLMLDRALSRFQGRALSSLRRLDLTRQVVALADRPNTAVKTLALLKQFTRWATAGGLFDADPLGGVTARVLGLKAYEPRERVLTPAELQALWARGDADAVVLKFCFLTACRIGEALQWEPGQVVQSVWSIPMTKNGRQHTVPLTPEAEALLPLPSPLPAYSSLAQRLQRRGDGWTAHDLRRSAATMMRTAGVSVLDIEAVLNHAPPKLVRVYQRHDPLQEKRAALSALALQLAKALKATE